MKPVSKAYVQKHAQNIANLSKSAKQTLAKRITSLDDWDEVATVVSETTKAYCEMSSAMTVEFYSGIRSASRVKSKYQAVSQNLRHPDTSYSAAISILQEAQEGRSTRPVIDLLADVANREIKNACDDTIRINVGRDPAKPKYAIVPNGDACAFCQMRASLGYTYEDESAVESHDHCTCMPTPVFGNQKIEGYNPKEYEAKYNEAKEALEKGNISDDLKDKIAAQKSEKGKDFDNTNAILMVMRDQQGIS